MVGSNIPAIWYLLQSTSELFGWQVGMKKEGNGREGSKKVSISIKPEAGDKFPAVYSYLEEVFDAR